MTEAAIVKKICAHNGSMNYDALISIFGLYDDAMGSVVGRSESCAVAFVNGQKKVIGRTKVRLCRAQNCTGCSNLHLCKWFLFGSCRFDKGRRGCRFSHDVVSGQNLLVLTAHGLDTLDVKELCILLMQSDHSLLPAVCHSYNNGTGPYGRCQDAENCKRLHICEKYLRGPCDCTRSHDFYEPHPLKTLQDRGVTPELMGIMKDLYSNIEVLRHLSKAASAPNAAGPNAKRGPNAQNRRPSTGFNAGRGQEAQRTPHYNTGSCRREHSTLPYKWEVREGSEWKALPDNEAIEKDYCNPARTCSSGINPVHFDMMSQGCYSVRRLSTVPSVLQPTFILTTEWIWYWEDEFGNWIQYATADGGHHLSSISSAELEQKYQADNNAVVEFTAGSQTYELSFTDMIQTNKRYATKKVIRRRPKFVSPADVQTIKTTKRMPNNFKALPDHWDKALTPETGYKRVSLQSTSPEYIKIKELFQLTMVGFKILRIERIQNKALWEVYQWQKDYMKKNNGGRDVPEKQLFHGTDSKHLDAICHNNFDWRICGTHGTAYGKGSYFARDAKYSHSYTKDSGTRTMFVCRILVGDYTKGESSFLRPPSKDGGDTIFYNSCVNDVYDPSIFVVFEKHQIYPEYLIEYRDSSGFDVPSHSVAAKPAVAARRPVAVSATPIRPSYISPYTAASSSHSSPSYTSSSSSSSNTSFYKPSSAASSSYTASYISSLNTSSTSASSSSSAYAPSPPRSSSSYGSTSPKPSKSDNQCIIS
ncbi:poly [ADP-ribose] polymerase 12-like protein [Labeo rohita]|uniref:Poly [ADP-ribose] polymerase 12-like protein n=1 Tax=Labeo rohita TaxID=84645 RepID=A0A498LIG2_LABRO|nr:poly [ADP-ribose] polymerase 12-like protein [Labeo rohita]RXN27226.1 poly [ADP-ribose] polymerase 12-like protein [Labeo rohita]